MDSLLFMSKKYQHKTSIPCHMKIPSLTTYTKLRNATLRPSFNFFQNFCALSMKSIGNSEQIDV